MSVQQVERIESALDPEPDLAAEAPFVRRAVLLRRVVVGCLVGLTVGIGWLLVEADIGPLELLLVALLAGLCIALAIQASDARDLARRRRERESGIRRFAQGLSRSLSPESVVGAIVADLRSATDADHVVVARVRQPDQTVEVTLAAARSSVPPSRTYLRAEIPERRRAGDGDGPAADAAAVDEAAGEAGANPDDPRAAAQAAAEEIARRVRAAYGLANTLAWPLVSHRRFLGALILSRRTRGEWSDADRRLLGWASTEVSTAFARAYALEAAERGANIDALTGLPNRRYFDEVLAIERPRRRVADSLGMLMIDIDRFKRLNDRYGHSTGDRVLRAVAGAIAAEVRADDTPARYGGEEFAVLLRRTSAEQAAEVGERVRLAVSKLHAASIGVDEPVTVSVGVAVSGPGEGDPATLVERADQALYRAKRLGRDRVVTA